VVEHQEEIDGNIQRFAPTWPVEQLSAIDRNILRLAISEILFDNRVIIKVAINEAVELAKKFGSENSSKFVNGVLGSISALAER
jgi:N utilization substance protein B